MHQRSVIFQSCVSTVKFLIMCFVPLPLALVVKYLSNKSVRKVKHIYEGLKLFSQVEPCTLWCRISEWERAFILLLSSTCCNICAAASGYKRCSCISHCDCGGNKLFLIVISSYIVRNKKLFLKWVGPSQQPSTQPAAHLLPSPKG